ncbi:hypothetical protein CJ030_MR6G019429 [Morella rubra]|uniref:Uncharacterized protein n=1 Tax=Morella rubra TaxID=262757 RepID=A0A6A1VB18_9ROSI|nr:hypothetical protein CJ030_MR6G019429 [Morella rubra]
MEVIVRPYGYNNGDLLYYKEPGKSLDEGPKLVSSDHDVLQMVSCYQAEQVVVLYLVSFVGNGGDEENDEAGGEDNEESKRRKIRVSDLFWSTVLSSDDEFTMLTLTLLNVTIMELALHTKVLELLHSTVQNHLGSMKVDDFDEVDKSGEKCKDEDENGEGNEVEDLVRDTEKGKEPMGDDVSHLSDGGRSRTTRWLNTIREYDASSQKLCGEIRGVTGAEAQQSTIAMPTPEATLPTITMIRAPQPASGSSNGKEMAVRETASQTIGGIASRVRAHQLERKCQSFLTSHSPTRTTNLPLTVSRLHGEDQDLKEPVWFILDHIPVSP